MKTVGETLKHRRERLGMTLAELEQRTQLKRQTLTLIENNDFYDLAKVDYTEGFIRKYANVVNIDANQLIKAHRDEIPSSQHQLDDLIEKYQTNQAPELRRSNKEPLQLISIIISLIIISVILWIVAVLLI